MHTVHGEWECAKCGKPCDPVGEEPFPQFKEDNRYMRAHEYPGIGEERFKRLLDTVEDIRREAKEEGARLALSRCNQEGQPFRDDHDPIGEVRAIAAAVEYMLDTRDYGFPVNER